MKLKSSPIFCDAKSFDLRVHFHGKKNQLTHLFYFPSLVAVLVLSTLFWFLIHKSSKPAMSLALLNTKAHCAAAPNSTVRPSVYLVVRAVSNDLYSLV